MAKVLNEKQQKFMAVLFDGANGDVVTAKKMAGYADTTATSDVIKGLKDEIAEATKDASLRASKIAESANSNLGKLISAQMGVFQIIAKNSTENYTWGGRHNKTSKNKTATVTAKLEYSIGL